MDSAIMVVIKRKRSLPKRIENRVLKICLHLHVYSSVNHNGKNVEAT